MKQQRLTLTPAPGAVFLRLGSPAVEMTPGEALRLCDEIMACARIALAAEDGQAIHSMMSRQPV